MRSIPLSTITIIYKLFFVLFLPVFLAGTISQAAEETSTGEQEYLNNCAQCHGIAGKGDGFLVEFLKKEPPDISVLQKNNGGVFPVSRVYSIIEGGDDVTIHGTRKMPAWGGRFLIESRNSRSNGKFHLDSPESHEKHVRAKILALIEYILTLQEK